MIELSRDTTQFSKASGGILASLAGARTEVIDYRKKIAGALRPDLLQQSQQEPTKQVAVLQA